MDIEPIIPRMEMFPNAVAQLTSDLMSDDHRWKPASGAWSILEVICHLADEEEFDFRPRLESTLSDPNAVWPPIDPEGWAIERRYNEQSLAEQLERFSRERAQSIGWLRGLNFPNWKALHQHPSIGPVRAGDLLVSWVCHDALHLRQLAKRLFELSQRDMPGFSTNYAGP